MDLRGEARRATGFFKLGEEVLDLTPVGWRVLVVVAVVVGLDGVSVRHVEGLVDLL